MYISTYLNLVNIKVITYNTTDFSEKNTRLKSCKSKNEPMTNIM